MINSLFLFSFAAIFARSYGFFLQPNFHSTNTFVQNSKYHDIKNRQQMKSNIDRIKSKLYETGTNTNTNINTMNDQDQEQVEDRDVSQMKVREIKEELKNRNVSFADCFDRESLETKLFEARLSTTTETSVATTPDVKESMKSTTDEKIDDSEDTEPTSEVMKESSFDRESTLEHLRSLRVKELRSELSSRKIRWANMFEKEELVMALADAMEKNFLFSRSGKLSPGAVTDLDDDILSLELNPIDNNKEKSSYPPMLLDVYATWCGPCKMMAPELDKAAEELGDSMRVAKLDSDQYSTWAQKLKVGGLPTLILFDGDGKEIDRVEGALRKDDLINFAKKVIS